MAVASRATMSRTGAKIFGSGNDRPYHYNTSQEYPSWIEKKHADNFVIDAVATVAEIAEQTVLSVSDDQLVEEIDCWMSEIGFNDMEWELDDNLGATMVRLDARHWVALLKAELAYRKAKAA